MTPNQPDSSREPRLRVYYVSHYSKAKLTNIVVARNAKEALEKDAAGDYVDHGWAGESFPVSNGVARWARDDKPENYPDAG